MARQRIIRGTADGKKYGLVKTQHKAGVGKMRCQGCKVGYAVQVMTADGLVYRCNRCGREYKVDQRLS